MYISNINSASVKLDTIQSQTISSLQDLTICSEDKLILVYINKGAANYTYKDITGEIKKRDIIILNPQHTINIKPIRKLDWIIVELSGIVFTSSAEIESIDELFVVADHSQTIKHYLDLALLEFKEPFRGSDLVLRKLIECVMVHVLRHHELSIKDASTQVRHKEIDNIKQYIREHFSEKITLEDLSKIVNINKYYLIRLFKQQTGLSPIDYLIHVRLSEAEKLLTQTEITISKIADVVGFHSPSHFSKTFKESNHMTPSAFRRKFNSQYHNN